MRWIDVLLILFLLFCCSVFAADRGCLVGGSSSNTVNPAFYNSDVLTATQAHNGNGASFFTDTAVAITDGTTDTTLTANIEGDFASLLVGMGIEVVFNDTGGGGTGTNQTAFISALNLAANPDEIDIDITWGGATWVGDDVDIVVGGAKAATNTDMQSVFDNSVKGTAASDNVIIRQFGDITLTTDLDKSAGGGTSTTRWSLIGVDTAYAELAAGSHVKLDGNSAAANVLDLGVSYCTVSHIEITGGIARGIIANTVDFTIIDRCSVHDNGTTMGILVDDDCLIIDSEIFNETEAIEGDATNFIINCTISNCTRGIDIINGLVSGCTLFDIVDEAITLTGINDCIVIGNTIDGDNVAGSVGLNVPSAAYVQILPYYNNVFYDLDTGVNFGTDLSSNIQAVRNNLFNSNNTDVTNSTTGTDPQTGAPVFVNEATRDYTPATGSPLIGNGLGENKAIGSKEPVVSTGGTFPRFIERHGD